MRLKVFGGEPQSGQASVRPSKKKADKKKAGKKKAGRRKGR